MWRCTLLVIEVADSTEYWIVDVEGKAVEIHSAPADGQYTSVTRHRAGERIAPAAFPDVVIELATVLVG